MKRKDIDARGRREEADLLENIQAVLGYEFKNPHLLKKALTHTSYAHEARQGEEHNERQEFLGDAVLELCVSTELYKRFPRAREGDLTRLRSSLVSGENLASLARLLGLNQVIRLGHGEERQGGRNRDTILSDALEAVFGAIYEDGGFDAARLCVARIFDGHWPVDICELPPRDNKSLLQQKSQKLFHEFPVYALLGTYGAEHAKIFEISVTLPDGRVFCASNSSCKKAEQDAAASALIALENNCP